MKTRFFAHLLTLALPVLASYLGLLLTTELETDWQWSLLLVVPCLIFAAWRIFHLTTLWAASIAGFCVGYALVYAVEAAVSYQGIEVSPYWYLIAPACAAAASTFRYIANRHRYAGTYSAFVPHQIFSAVVTTSLLATSPPAIFLRAESTIGHARNADIAIFVEAAIPGYALDDRKYFRLLFADNYLFFTPERLSDARKARDVHGVIRAMISPSDRWSGIVAAEKPKPNAQRRPRLGFIDLRDEADGFIILQLAPNSAAANAGLHRGDKLVHIDGMHVLNIDSSKAKNPPSRPVPVEYIGQDGRLKSVSMQRVEYARPYVWKPLIFDVAGKKVGYVAYDEFTTQADSALISAMGTLANAHVSELILDLRYNPGGLVEVLGKVASMLVPTDGFGKLAYRYESRSRFQLDRKDTFFKDAGVRPVTAPSRLIVITSDYTCSASEALIHILRPYMQVVTIGSKTCGKYVGGSNYTRPSATVTLIAFKLHDAHDKPLPKEGIEPTCAAEDDVRFQRGDPRESSLAEAIYYAEFGKCRLPG